jgi:hypothetical protein
VQSRRNQNLALGTPEQFAGFHVDCGYGAVWCAGGYASGIRAPLSASTLSMPWRTSSPTDPGCRRHRVSATQAHQDAATADVAVLEYGTPGTHCPRPPIATTPGADWMESARGWAGRSGQCAPDGVPVGAEVSLPGQVEEVDPVPEQGKPVGVQVWHGHVKESAECLGRTVHSTLKWSSPSRRRAFSITARTAARLA